ncbi:MAG: hypothetical protein M1820_003746 [Bogoriella megaspora]|nr:MAG: hypothetical protein M1820_003746 [Bogoriella megaspora]
MENIVEDEEDDRYMKDLLAERQRLAVSWPWVIAAVGMLTARFWYRARHNRQFEGSDFLLLLATVQFSDTLPKRQARALTNSTQIISIALSIVWANFLQHGGRPHMYTWSESRERYIMRLNRMLQPSAAVGLVCCKLSLAYWAKMLPYRFNWHTIALWLLCIIAFIWSITGLITIFVWGDTTVIKLSVEVGEAKGHRWSPPLVAKSAFAFHSYMPMLDLAIALLVMHGVWLLDGSRTKKLTYSAIIAAGVLASVNDIIGPNAYEAAQIAKIGEGHWWLGLTWATVDSFTSNAREINRQIIFVCAYDVYLLFRIVLGYRDEDETALTPLPLTEPPSNTDQKRSRRHSDSKNQVDTKSSIG